jgi:uncharacterized membrane protein required for colicin V production
MNWYDIVVLVALLYGVWSGLRTGFSGEIIRVLGLVLMVVLALAFYLPLGAWLQHQTNLTDELANLLAFLSIAVVVYVIATAVRMAVHRRVQQLGTTALIENVGGAVAGCLRMGVLMAWLTVMLALISSPFWHQQIARNSFFGSYVVSEVPAVADFLEKKFPEKAQMLENWRGHEKPPAESDKSDN